MTPRPAAPVHRADGQRGGVRPAAARPAAHRAAQRQLRPRRLGRGRLSHSDAPPCIFIWRIANEMHRAASEWLQRPRGWWRREVRAAARAGDRRFGPLSALRAHTKAPYKTDLHRKTLRPLDRPWDGADSSIGASERESSGGSPARSARRSAAATPPRAQNVAYLVNDSSAYTPDG
jgi:hypothetical protein